MMRERLGCGARTPEGTSCYRMVCLVEVGLCDQYDDVFGRLKMNVVQSDLNLCSALALSSRRRDAKLCVCSHLALHN